VLDVRAMLLGAGFPAGGLIKSTFGQSVLCCFQATIKLIDDVLDGMQKFWDLLAASPPEAIATPEARRSLCICSAVICLERCPRCISVARE
jgi:hypothetical protein